MPAQAEIIASDGAKSKSNEAKDAKRELDIQLPLLSMSKVTCLS